VRIDPVFRPEREPVVATRYLYETKEMYERS